MWRLTDRMVRSTLVTAWRLATSPTSTSPFLAKATTDGVVRAPSALAMTVGSPPSRTATTLLVVPRSMPTARAMVGSSFWSIVESIRLKFAHWGQRYSVPDVFPKPGTSFHGYGRLRADPGGGDDRRARAARRLHGGRGVRSPARDPAQRQHRRRRRR